VNFLEAATAFSDPLLLTIPHPAHLEREQPFIRLGRSAGGKKKAQGSKLTFYDRSEELHPAVLGFGRVLHRLDPFSIPAHGSFKGRLLAQVRHLAAPER
jgi:hypothetical protein